MKKVEILLILLFIAVIITAFFSLRYISPSESSIKECFKIEDETEKEDCITAVAGINQDSSICDFLTGSTWIFSYSNPREKCKDAVREWGDEYGLFIPPAVPISDSSLSMEECADRGLWGREYYFLKLPYDDYWARYYEFAPGCEEKLKALNESYCLPEDCSFFEPHGAILSRKQSPENCTGNFSSVTRLSYCNYGDLPITITFRICKSGSCANYPKEVTIPANECIYEEVCDSGSVYVTDVQWPSIKGCDIDSIDKYDLSSCITNIGIAKGAGAAKTCENQNIMDSHRDSCYMKYAHVHNDKTICSLSGYDDECYYGYAIIHEDESLCGLLENTGYYDNDKDGCTLYFALKNKDANSCDKISDSDTIHLCKAIILAQEEAEQ